MATDRGNLTGQTLGTCTLEKLVGEGGMGAVYLARQSRPARHVAVKVLLPNLTMNSTVYQEFLARFRREADLIARLEHINIMPIYEYGEQDGIAYLVMPYLPGGSLRDVLIQRNALSLQETLSYIDQAASALDYAHAQGVIHRDLKPGNFLLHSDGRLVLADFGIARMMDDSKAGSGLTGTGTILGTPEYMAPEMARGDTVDYRADIYELGVVLFQMLTGQVPFTGNTPYAVVAKHVQEPMPLVHKINPALPAAVDTVLQKATAKYREQRYSSVKEMALALRQASAAPTHYIGNTQLANQNKTAASSGGPLILPSPPTQQYTPAQRYPHTPPSATSHPGQSQLAQAQYPPQAGSVNYSPVPPPPYPGYRTGSSMPPQQQQGSSRAMLWLVGIVLAVVLIVGSIFAAVLYQRARNRASFDATPTASNTTPIATVTTTASPTVTPTAVPSTTPTATPGGSTVQATVPAGPELYAATRPGGACDSAKGRWANFNNARVTCLPERTRLASTARKNGNLQGIFLTSLPKQSYPADYVVQVQVQREAGSSGDFGLYFRNQPGNQLGAYAFLIHPDGSWNAYVYDNDTGNPTEIAGGNLGTDNATMTLAVIVSGSQFTFYADGQSLGSANDSTYDAGTAGITVGPGAIIATRNFALYTPQ